MEQTTLLSRLQVKSKKQSQGMSNEDERDHRASSNELESIRLAQQLAREEFERDQRRNAEEQKTLELIKAL